MAESVATIIAAVIGSAVALMLVYTIIEYAVKSIRRKK